MARRDMELRHLEMADRHIAESAERITNQEALIADLKKGGHDTVQANRLLELFNEAQAQSVDHRRLILEALEALDEPEDGAAAS